MTKAEAYIFLHEHCKKKVQETVMRFFNGESVHTFESMKWQACFDLLDEELEFHKNMLEGRE